MQLLLALLAAFVGSAMNSVAGGGTLVTFPAIVWLGVTPLVANATSTVALWPGALGSLWGYRAEVAGSREWFVRFTVPSLAGGGVGALLLLSTPPEGFEAVVPYLVLGATVLFLLQKPIARRVLRGAVEGHHGHPRWPFLVAQFGVGIYGGYFGAGIGILMLATLGAMGLTNIHQMNGLKNWGGLCINAVAALLFAFSGIVNWPVALAMAAGGILGGYGGARLARRAGEARVRRAVVAIGFASFAYLLLR